MKLKLLQVLGYMAAASSFFLAIGDYHDGNHGLCLMWLLFGVCKVVQLATEGW
jgi:hypothetical protein